MRFIGAQSDPFSVSPPAFVNIAFFFCSLHIPNRGRCSIQNVTGQIFANLNTLLPPSYDHVWSKTKGKARFEVAIGCTHACTIKMVF